MRKQFVKTMEELGAANPRLVALLGDISVFAMRNFQERFPNRFYNLGICEQAMVSIAAGLAEQGWIPVVHTIAPFLIERAYEQIKDDLCYQRCGVNLVSVGAAFDYTPDGPTHHCWGDFGLLRILPGMEVVSPGSPMELDLLFRQSYDNGNPTYFRLSASQHGVAIADDQIQFGRAIIITPGRTLTLVVTGPRLRSALEAAALFQEVEVVYVHTLKPLDAPLIRASVAKTRRVLCIEEHSISTGLAAAVAEVIGDLRDVRMTRLGVPDKFLANYGTYDEICAMLRLDAAGITKTLRQIWSNGSGRGVSDIMVPFQDVPAPA